MENFETYCKNFIKDNISEFIGNDYYGCDFGYELTQDANCNGSLTYSTHEAIEYLREWWYEAGDYSDYEQFNFGERSNPFANPEAFMVRMVIEGVNSLLSQCNEIGENWDDKFELTQEIANSICEQIDEFNIEF